MQAGALEGRQVFRASWRSSNAVLAIVLLLLAVGSVVATVFAGTRGGWIFASMAVAFVLLAWLLLLPLLSRHPLLQVDAQGISGFQLRGHRVPWAEIANVDHLTIQGQDQIQLALHDGAPSLAATRRWFSARTLRGIPLGALRRADRPLATQAALQAFHRHAGEQAALAMNQHLDDLVAHEAFEERLRLMTPNPWAVYLVIAVNVAVWLLNLWDGLSPMAPTPDELFAWGANSATAVVRDGEYWRLLTATVLHGGVLHLGLNMFALWDAGRRVCRWYGNGQFLLIYLGAGLAGSALSLHFSSQEAVSVGASGAVFGVLGALLVGVYQHRSSVPKAMATQLLTSQGLFVGLMLAQGFTRSGIDNAAHVGGLLTGALLAWLLIELIDEHAGAARRLGRQTVSVLAVLLVVGGLVTTARPGVDHGRLFATHNALNDVLPRLQAAEKALQTDFAARSSGTLDDAGLVDAMERTHIPAYREVDTALQGLDTEQVAPMMRDVAAFNRAMLEVMTLEVAQFRGTASEATTRARLAELSDELKTVGDRLRAASPASDEKP